MQINYSGNTNTLCPNLFLVGDCIGASSGGNGCNERYGICEKYCCKERTLNPCRTPICPLNSTPEMRAENEREQRRICTDWRAQPVPRGQRRGPYSREN